MADPSLAILLISAGHERAHYAFAVAAAAAAIGRSVTLFATNEGCRALLADPSAIADWPRDAAVQKVGVGGLLELREAAVELGVHLVACDAGLAMAGLDPANLLPGVEVAGIPALLESDGPVVTL